jgi:hypothetical protein
MSQNRNKPSRPRYRKHRRHAKHFQEYLDRESARYDGQATQTSVTAVSTDFEFAATISGSPGPYRIVGVPPTELKSLDQFYLKPFDEGGTDKAEVFGSNNDVGAGRKITMASRDLAPTISGVNTTTDALGLEAHGMSTGDGPFQLTTTTTLPAGLSATTDYYAIKLSDDEFQAAVSVDATTSGIQIDITDIGTGTHSVDFSFVIEQDMSADGLVGYMARGISRERIREGAATSSGINEVFQ